MLETPIINKLSNLQSSIALYVAIQRGSLGIAGFSVEEDIAYAIALLVGDFCVSE